MECERGAVPDPLTSDACGEKNGEENYRTWPIIDRTTGCAESRSWSYQSELTYVERIQLECEC